MCFEYLCLMLLLENLLAVELSVLIGVLPCLCPISSSVTRIGQAVLALWKTAPISLSAALDWTNRRSLLSTSIGPLNVGFCGIGFGCSLR